MWCTVFVHTDCISFLVGKKFLFQCSGETYVGFSRLGCSHLLHPSCHFAQQDLRGLETIQYKIQVLCKIAVTYFFFGFSQQSPSLHSTIQVFFHQLFYFFLSHGLSKIILILLFFAICSPYDLSALLKQNTERCKKTNESRALLTNFTQDPKFLRARIQHIRIHHGWVTCDGKK